MGLVVASHHGTWTAPGRSWLLLVVGHSGTSPLLVLSGVAIFVLVVLIAWLASRHKDISPEARRRALNDAVAAWVAQGWAPVSQTGSTAVLRRGDEHTVLSVDGRGNITSQAVSPDTPGG